MKSDYAASGKVSKAWCLTITCLKQSRLLFVENLFAKFPKKMEYQKLCLLDTKNILTAALHLSIHNHVFTYKQEECLASYLKTSSNMFHGLTPKKTRQLSFQMPILNNLTMPDKWHAKKMAGTIG